MLLSTSTLQKNQLYRTDSITIQNWLLTAWKLQYDRWRKALLQTQAKYVRSNAKSKLLFIFLLDAAKKLILLLDAATAQMHGARSARTRMFYLIARIDDGDGLFSFSVFWFFSVCIHRCVPCFHLLHGVLLSHHVAIICVITFLADGLLYYYIHILKCI